MHYSAQAELADRLVGGAGAATGEAQSIPSAPGRCQRVCEECGASFAARRTECEAGRARFCSRSCAAKVKARLVQALYPQQGSGNFNFKQWRSREKRTYVDRFRAKYPEKAAAHDAVRCAVPCSTQAHHEDYSLPLDVQFVCRDCHRSLDAERRERHRAQAALNATCERVSSVQVPVMGEVR